MEPFASLLPTEAIEGLALLPYGWAIVPLAIAMLMAVAIASSLPATVTPVAVLGGALLGYSNIFYASIGAVIGSQLLFVLSRYWLGDYMRRRFGARIDEYHGHLATKGPIYVAGLRFGGVPHVLLTASAAAAPISGLTFALATLLGMMPGIVIGTLAGHAVF